MRLWLLLAALLLAGCTQPGASPVPTPGPLPPSLLVDRSPLGTLQLYVHAKQGLVRYDHLNLTVDNATAFRRAGAYSLEEVLPSSSGHVQVDVVQGELAWTWAARLALDPGEHPPLLTVEVLEDGEYAPARDFGLPYEKLLPRQEAR